jgi:hypothetical protein
MPRNSTTSLVELRTIAAGLRYLAEACAKIPPYVRSDKWVFINSHEIRVSDLRSAAHAYNRLTREIRRRQGRATAEDRQAAERDEVLRAAAPKLAGALDGMAGLAGDWIAGARKAALEEAKAALAAAGWTE